MADDTPSPEQMRAARIAEMRKRPRSKREGAALTAYFDPDPRILNDAVMGLSELLRSLLRRNAYIQQWRVVRDAKDHDGATGLDPVVSPDLYLAHERKSAKQGDDMWALSMLGFSELIYPESPEIYTTTLSYRGGPAQTGGSVLRIGFNSPDKDLNLTLAEYLDLIAAIVAWRSPRAIHVGSSNYAVHDRLFDHRAWDGWIGWYPADLPPGSLPETASRFPIGPGIAVASQPEPVMTRDATHLANARATELALVEAGVLPSLSQLQGR